MLKRYHYRPGDLRYRITVDTDERTCDVESLYGSPGWRSVRGSELTCALGLFVVALARGEVGTDEDEASDD